MSFICKCGKNFDLVAALDAMAADQIGSSGMFLHTCASCGESSEGRLRPGRVEFGYNYWAGSLHWEAMAEIRLRGLKVRASEPDDLEIVLGKRRWRFGIRTVSRERYIVLERAFAVGRRLGELDFAQWNVAVAGIERGPDHHEPAADFVIAAGDFLTLTGPRPALIRAWHYINDGRPKRR